MTLRERTEKVRNHNRKVLNRRKQASGDAAVASAEAVAVGAGAAVAAPEPVRPLRPRRPFRKRGAGDQQCARVARR